MKLKTGIAVLVVLVLGLLVNGWFFNLLDQKNIKESVLVKKVIDGDTIETEQGNRIRLIGIDAPELTSKNVNDNCWANKAKERMIILVGGKNIEIEKDVSDKDKYGRQLRYVWINKVLANQKLVEEGLAKVEYIWPDVRYYLNFKKLEKAAKDQRMGMWSTSCN